MDTMWGGASGDSSGAWVLPKRVCIRAELHDYLGHNRQKCQATIEVVTEQRARRLCRHGRGDIPFDELLVIRMCHVQEHGAQSNMFLGQHSVRTPNRSKTKER